MIAQYDSTLVLMSYAVSFLGAYVAISSCEQLRSVYIKTPQPSLFQGLPWLILIGSSLGGAGIWCMHFIGISAMSLRDSAGNEATLKYNNTVSVISLIVAVIFVIGGVLVASKDLVFAKTKEQILELLVDDFKSRSLAQIKDITQLRFLTLVSISELKYLAMGGMIAASGVVVMHYLGIAAIEFDGHIEWNIGIIAASIIIAILASVAAFWILFRLLSIYPDWESLRVASSFVMGIAVCGMHYCGMMAADFKLNDSEHSEVGSGSASSSSDSLYPVLFAVMATLWIFAMFIFADLRSKLNLYHGYLRKIVPNKTLSEVLTRIEAMSRNKKLNRASFMMTANHNAVAPAPPTDRRATETIVEQNGDCSDNSDSRVFTAVMV